MKRSFWALGLVAVSAGLLIADEVPTKPVAGPRPAVVGRKQIEALLQSPAQLDFEGRKAVSVREVLDRLHEQHHLSLRFDLPTLATMLHQSSSGNAGQSPPAGVYYAPSAMLPSSRSGMTCQTGVCSSYVSPAPVCCAPAAAPSKPLNNYSSTWSDPKATLLASAYTAAPGADSAPEPSPPEIAVQPFPSAPVQPAATAASSRYVKTAPPAVPPAAFAAPAATAKLPPATASPSSLNLPAPYQAVAPATAAPAAVAPQYSPAAAPAPVGPAYPAPLNPAQNPENLYEPKPGPATPEPLKSKTTHELLAELLDTEIELQTLDLSRVSIATVLRQALGAVPTAAGGDSEGMPILLTNASLLDYLVEDDGLLITTRMKALTAKETRVYSLKQLADIPPDELSKTIRQSIRPWSWRSQFHDMGEQLKGTPIPPEMLTSMLRTGAQLLEIDSGISVVPASASSEAPESKSAKAAMDILQMEMLGRAMTNGLVALAESTLLGLEMVHYAEPPTGTIQLLGNRLVVTQSQSAHREIAELLKQLSEE
jgi:hypothetical protein